MDLGTLIANGTMNAAADILAARGRKVTETEIDALVESLRREGKAAVATILDDGKALVDSGNPGWLNMLASAECVSAAQRAVDAVFGEVAHA